jgi:hypothetical protein
MDDSRVLVTLVVRLVSERLAAGEFVGEVEHVGEGGRAVVRDVSDLVAFAERAAAAAPIAEGTGDGPIPWRRWPPGSASTGAGVTPTSSPRPPS